LYPGSLKDEIFDFDQYSLGYGIKILQNLKNPNPLTAFNVDKQTIFFLHTLNVDESKGHRISVADFVLENAICEYYTKTIFLYPGIQNHGGRYYYDNSTMVQIP
jgi:hypothetical protein